MIEDVNNAAAPSSAATLVADNWDESGTPIVTAKPEPPKKEEPAASDPQKDAKPEKVSAEPGAAKPKAKPNAEERISQLTAERRAEKDRADELDRRLRELESKPAPAPKVETKAAELPKRPNPFSWTGTQEEFDKAMDKWEEHRDALAVARVRQEAAQSEVQKSMSEMLKQSVTKHPDAEAKIKTATAEIIAKAPPYVQSFVNDSEVLGELLYELSDPAKLGALLETAKANPGKALRMLHSMELELQKAPAAPKPEEKAKPEEKETKPRAPKPPSEVGGRGAATEDAAISAARDGKFGDFEAEMSRRHFAAS